MSSVPASLPWYKQFWPWFIIALLSSAVLASFASLYFALRGSDVVLEHSDSAD